MSGRSSQRELAILAGALALAGVFLYVAGTVIWNDNPAPDGPVPASCACDAASSVGLLGAVVGFIGFFLFPIAGIIASVSAGLWWRDRPRRYGPDPLPGSRMGRFGWARRFRFGRP